MKLFYITLSFILLQLLFSCNNSKKNSAVLLKQYHVWGNCSKCKATIEKACNINGVNTAIWSEDSKLLTLKIDTSILAVETVLKAIADSGYDNELFFANDYAYSKLDISCQYERRAE
jgi:copper chaperone CopZ